MNKRKLWKLMAALGLAGTSLLLTFPLLGQITVGAASGGMDCPTGGSPVCDTLTNPMERCLCHFVTSIYPDGLLTNWLNPHLPGHFDHTPMRDYGENQPAISESASMLALYAALIGDQATFDDLFEVSAPAEIGGTGAPMSSAQESPYYFASPNLCQLHWILNEDGYKKSDGDWLASAAGEENRWLEALSIAERKFPAPKYRLFANCLAWGLMGATDFNADAVGHFEDPSTPEAFDDYLLCPYFGWKEDFSGFASGTFSNLSYNNMMGWRYAAQLGQESHPLYQTTSGAGGTETITVPLQAIGSIRIDMTQRGTDYGYSLYEVEAYNPFTDTNLLLNADCTASSYQDDMYCSVCTCEKALDGNLSTRWSSKQPAYPGGPLAPQWLVITPTHPGRVMTITLHWEMAHASSYSLTAFWPFADFYSNVLSHTAPLMIGSIQQCGTDLPRVMYDIERHFYYDESLTPNLSGTSSLTALDLARRAAAYAKVSGDTTLWEMGRRILGWYKARYSSSIAAAYDPCTGDPLPGWENGEWPSIMADLAELAAEYCDISFARQVIEEKLRPRLITDPNDPLYGSVGPSAFENLEVLLALRHVDERCCLYLPIIMKNYPQP